MQKQILKLHTEGYSYREIAKKLGCSTGTVSYHCGDGQKAKTKERSQEIRKTSVILNRVRNFHRPDRNKSKPKVPRKAGRVKQTKRSTFTWKDVIAKFGWETTCYLTGQKINLRDPKTYEFDHIVPYSRGGSTTLDNLGIATRDANQMKSNRMLTELLLLCEAVLRHHGWELWRPAHMR
jgi:5-methylcytosine-specific restriction endonuclease McrA